MARLPPSVPPPRRASLARPLTPSLAPVAFSVAPLDDEASLAKTTVKPPARDPRIAKALEIVTEARALLRDPRGVFGAAVWTACVIAGVTGVIVGHAHSTRAHAYASASPAQRTPHSFDVVEAREEITELPVLAPGKEIATDDAAPTAAVSSRASATKQRRSGFGHLGADRVASGAPRRSAAHRR